MGPTSEARGLWTSQETAYAVAVGANGEVWAGGATPSQDFPRNGSWRTTVTDLQDAYIVRFDAGLTQILAASLVGGSQREGVYALVLDAEDNLFAAGFTTSPDFPAYCARPAGLWWIPRRFRPPLACRSRQPRLRLVSWRPGFRYRRCPRPNGREAPDGRYQRFVELPGLESGAGPRWVQRQGLRHRIQQHSLSAFKHPAGHTLSLVGAGAVQTFELPRPTRAAQAKWPHSASRSPPGTGS